MDWKTAFDIYTDNQYPLESRLFQDASAVLWNHIQKIANILSSGYHIAVDPDEMTSIFLCRLLKRRNQSFLPISGKSSYISTALRNISIDQYRSELKHATPEADTGRRTKVSLDQSLPEGRQLHELIAAPIQDDDDNIPLFEELEKQLDDRLYDVEIDQVIDIGSMIDNWNRDEIRIFAEFNEHSSGIHLLDWKKCQ